MRNSIRKGNHTDCGILSFRTYKSLIYYFYTLILQYILIYIYNFMELIDHASLKLLYSPVKAICAATAQVAAIFLLLELIAAFQSPTHNCTGAAW
jgi:hypothetical protein